MMRKLLLAFGVALCSPSHDAAAQAEPVPLCDACHAQTAAYQVEGMSCEGCAKHVKDALAKEPGVKKVEIDLAGKKVTVTYDGAKTDTKKIRDAIEKLGYKASLLT